jgi:hypothetical protein
LSYKGECADFLLNCIQKEDEVMHLAPSQRSLTEDLSPAFSAGRKLSEVAQALLWTLLQEDPGCPSRVLLDKVALRQIPIAVSLRHINRWRATWGRNRRKGRPHHPEGPRPVASGAAVIQVTPRLSFVGVHLFAHWLDQQDAFGPVVAQLTQAVEAHKHTHPGNDFALLHHREQTLLCRFQALFFAPLLGIDRLTGFDTHEHPLQTLLGRGYHSSTLRQFLGQLECVGAAEALMSTLLPAKAGQLIYVDGHMIAYWSRRSMHKGKITMLGRIMAGSQAVIAHDDAGQAVFVAYYPPDIHVSQVIVPYCQKVALATGRALFVIDRAVNAVALAGAFDDQGVGLLCMLDDNEHEGLESFAATAVDILEDGTRVYSGPWKASRPDDPRHFVIVVPAEGKTVVYWGTPKVEETLAASEWPRVYRERNEIQEHSFKRMIDHGGLDINYGRKTILGPDRHHQRQAKQLAQSLETAHKRVDKKAEAVKAQQEKVAESTSQEHGKRLEQRKRHLVTLEQEFKDAKAKQTTCSEQVAALGPAGQRADRDFRKQTIMTIRTLLLENTLRAFLVALLATLQTKVSLEQVLRLLFERSGARMETLSQVVYWVNTAGLSLPNRRLLSEIVEGLCAMDLQDQGKPIHVRLKDMPP